jgi:ribonuclease BN (tRNA processing enzyme)
MRILIGGARGSTPRAGADFTGYGGHTTCLLVLGDAGERLLFDLGSGVHEAAPHLQGDGELLVLLTHLHLDHVMGLTGFDALHQPGRRVHIAAVSYGGYSLHEALDRIHSPPLWPLSLEDLASDLHLDDLLRADLDAPGPLLRLGGLEIRGAPVPHPGGCTAWRVDEPATGAAFVMATDLEWSRADDACRDRLHALCEGADLLYMDGHFTTEEIPDHEGWGHSTPAQCLELARAAGVGRLLVGHHAPSHDDDRLADIERTLVAAWDGAALARQGQQIPLPSPRTPGPEETR